MWKQLRRLGLIVVLALGIRGAFAASATAQAASAAAPKTINDRYAEVASLAPGFGGMFVNPDLDTLYVYLLEDTPAAVAALEAALTAVLGAEAPKQSRLVVLQGQYSFLDLKAWHDHMRGVVGGIPGVVFTGISHSQNRLAVGVEREDVQPLVEEQLALLGIPREAVIIEKHPPVKFLSSLQDMHRPLVGGLQISFFRPGLEPQCTLGFNAVRAVFPGFVTASHCTANPGGEENTEFFQHLSPLRVGVEALDPRYLPGGPCPVNPDGTPRYCRYSDSAFAVRDAGVEADRGFIANPPLNIGQPDPDAWNGVDRFRIVGEATTIMVGDHVNKVGRTTGRTRGIVTHVCIDTNVPGTNVTFLCQSHADFAVDQGDSGAPVFNIVDVAPENVRLYGILWAAPGWFSPIENIQRADELGQLIKCAPGFGC